MPNSRLQAAQRRELEEEEFNRKAEEAALKRDAEKQERIKKREELAAERVRSQLQHRFCHFSRISQLFASHTCHVMCLLGAHADRVRVGAPNPMLCCARFNVFRPRSGRRRRRKH